MYYPICTYLHIFALISSRSLLHKCVDDKNSVRNGALLCAAYRERVDIAFSLIIPENARICVLNILRRQL